MIVRSLTENHSFELPLTNSLSTDNLVKLLNQHFTNLTAINYNGHLLLIEGESTGKNSRIIIEGSAREALGFSFRSRTRGTELYPAWRVEKRPYSLDERFIKFVKPIMDDPIIMVTYSAPPQQCLRCRSTLVENDFRIDSNGVPLAVVDENLLYQICLKAMLTKKGSNFYYRWYGTNIMGQIGRKISYNVAGFIKGEIERAFRLVKKAQTAQSKFQKVSRKERLSRVLGVVVTPHKDDPTVFLVEVTVQNASSQSINLSIVYTVPGAVALRGSNGLSLGVT